jgi:hypothetical protein
MCKKFLKKGKNIKQCRIKRQAGFLRQSTCSIIMLVLIVVGGVYYLGLINNKATVGYRMADLEGQITGLTEVNQKLELELIELGQITRIERAAEDLAMVVSEEVDYLATSEEGLAVR